MQANMAAVEGISVRENLNYAAELRLGGWVDAKEREHIVDDIMARLHLTRCAHVPVRFALSLGDSGISGGQLRLLSIAIQWLKLYHSSNGIMLLDEPTSGLDSRAALTVVSILHDLARSGLMVVLSIHQPRTEIYELFDDVIFLTEGRLVYNGSTGGWDGIVSKLCGQDFAASAAVDKSGDESDKKYTSDNTNSAGEFVGGFTSNDNYNNNKGAVLIRRPSIMANNPLAAESAAIDIEYNNNNNNNNNNNTTTTTTTTTIPPNNPGDSVWQSAANPVDAYLDMLADSKLAAQLRAMFEASDLHAAMESQMKHAASAQVELRIREPITFFKQIVALHRRAHKWSAMITGCVVSLVAGVVLGISFGAAPVLNNWLLGLAACCMATGVFTQLIDAFRFKTVFDMDYLDTRLSPLAFVFQITFSRGFEQGLAVWFLFVPYYLLAFPSEFVDVKKFLACLAVLVLFCLTFVSLNILICVVSSSPFSAQRLAIILYCLFGLFGGTVLPARNLPVYLHWIIFINPLYYAFIAMLKITLQDRYFGCDYDAKVQYCPTTSGNVLLSIYVDNQLNLDALIGILGAAFVFIELLGMALHRYRLGS